MRFESCIQWKNSHLTLSHTFRMRWYKIKIMSPAFEVQIFTGSSLTIRCVIPNIVREFPFLRMHCFGLPHSISRQSSLNYSPKTHKKDSKLFMHLFTNRENRDSSTFSSINPQMLHNLSVKYRMLWFPSTRIETQNLRGKKKRKKYIFTWYKLSAQYQ